MENWLALTTIAASIATILALIVSDDFLSFVRKIVSSRWSQYGFLVLITMLSTYISVVHRDAVMGLVGPNWPPSKGIAHDIHLGNRDLRCGVNGYLDGFSLQRNGKMEGFDVDFCRAVAVAISGNDSAVKYVKLTDAERFQAVEKGDVDVMFRNTSRNAGRDLGYKVDFGPTIFYDEQGILVPISSGIETIQDLRGKKICVLKETTSRENLERFLDINDVNPLPKIVTQRDGDSEFEDNQEVFQTYGDIGSGICDAVTSDMSQIKVYRNRLDDPGDHVTIPNLDIAQELLSPVYVEGDKNWANIVSYVVYATIHAAELGITRDNVSEFAESDNRTINQFLGLTDDSETANIGEILGIERDFAYQVIKAVGNYDEIYQRNLGDLIPDRGDNALWKRDGLLISPPFTLPEAEAS